MQWWAWALSCDSGPLVTKMAWNANSYFGNQQFNRHVFNWVPLSSRCLHIQGPGSQSNGFLHSVHCHHDSSIDGGVYRFHCTFRFTLCPKDNKLTRFAAELSMAHFEIPEKKKKGPQNYMENNVLTRCVTYQVDRRDNKEVQEPVSYTHLTLPTIYSV